MPQKKTTWLSKAKKPLLALVSTVATLLVCEVVVRTCGLAPPVQSINFNSAESVYKRSSNPILGYELKASYRNAGGDPNSVNTNSHGLRDVERKTEKPPGVKRILVLGDSVTQGNGLSNLADTIPRQLQNQFDADKNDQRVEVLNFGIDGYCTRAEIELLEVKGLAFDPDIVIVIFVENDFMNFNTDTNRLRTKRPALANQMFVHSELFRFAALRLNLFSFGTEHDPVAWNNRAIGDNNVADGLARFGQLASSRGFTPLLAIWPRFGNDSIVDMHEMPDKFGRLIVEQLAEANNIPSLRLSAFFDKHLQSLDEGTSPNRIYTVGDQMHPSAMGSLVAAEALKNVLEDLEHGAFRVRSDADKSKAIKAASAVSAKIKPTNFRSIVNLGNDALDAGDLAQASALYEKARDLQPEMPDAYFGLGLVHERRNQLDEAVLDYTSALERDSSHLPSLYNLGLIHAKRSELAAAKKCFEKVLRIDPDHFDSHHNLGVVFLNSREYEKAAAKFKYVLKRNPQRRDTQFALQQALRLIDKGRPSSEDKTD